MFELFAVFIGGSIGATLRYFISLCLSNLNASYYPTFLINTIGCFIIGLVSYLAIKSENDINNHLKLFLTTGFCGGFTTFSTFCLDFFKLNQTNQVMLGFTYLFMSLFAGLLAVMFGFIVANRLANVVFPTPAVLQEEYADEISDDELEQEPVEV